MNVTEENIDEIIQQYEILNDELDRLLALSAEIEELTTNIDKFAE